MTFLDRLLQKIRTLPRGAPQTHITRRQKFIARTRNFFRNLRSILDAAKSPKQ